MQTIPPIVKRRGKKGNIESLCDEVVKLANSMKSNTTSDEVFNNILKNCMDALAKHTKDEHFQLLDSTRKIKDPISATEGVDANSTMTNAEGDEKVFYETAIERMRLKWNS